MSEWLFAVQIVTSLACLIYVFINRSICNTAIKHLNYSERECQKLIIENEKLSDENKDLRHQLLVLKTRNVR